MTRAHLPAIDGLRAVAVLAVVAYHAGLPVPAGFVGVDVFFVISGYVITRLLAAGPIDFLAFYARRARRILPALVVLVVAVLIASAFLLAPDGEQQRLAKSAAASLLFAGNVFFQSTTGGYFDPSTETMPLLHLWSLGVEEQFYLLWPLLLVAARKRLPVLALASFVLAEVWLWFNPEAAFYQMPARFWELAVGGMIALGSIKVPVALWHRWIMPAGVLLTLAACLLPLPHFPGAGALPAVLGASCVLLAAHNGQRSGLLESRPMVAVGLVSYSLYLWHWPLLAFAKVQGWPVAVVALAFPLAWLSYRYVEQPFRRAQGPSRRIVGVGVAVSLVMALCAFSYGLRTLVVSPALQAERDRPWAAMKCHQQETEAPRALCRGKVVIWGDSMALAWSPAFGAANVSRDACGPSGKAKTARATAWCAEFNRQAMTYLASGEVDTLILAWRWTAGDDYLRGLEELAAQAHVRRLLIVGPSPTMPRPVPECLAHGMDCGVSRADFDAQAAPIRARLAKIGTLLDPAPLLCEATRCPAVKDGRALYWDAYHVARSTAVRLNPGTD